MASVHDAFPSNWLKAADLQGRDFPLKIKSVGFEDIGDDRKLVVYFEKTQKGLVLNKTNAMSIADVYGDDYDHWAGATVTLYPDKTNMNGQRVACIRVRCTQPPPQQGNGRPSVPATGPAGTGVLDDDIPFAPSM